MVKVMLVEDDNNLREIYGARLSAEGYEIVSAKDGEEALALAVKEKPDLILSDVMMPRISGFDMLDILRNAPETRNTKVIMMTALSQAEDKARADKLGADRYLVKSQVTLEDVANVVRDVLAGDSPEDDQPSPTFNPDTDPISQAAARVNPPPPATPPPVQVPDPVIATPAQPIPEPVVTSPPAPPIAEPAPLPPTPPTPEPEVVAPAPPTPEPVVAAPSPPIPAPVVTPPPAPSEPPVAVVAPITPPVPPSEPPAMAATDDDEPAFIATPVQINETEGTTDTDTKPVPEPTSQAEESPEEPVLPDLHIPGLNAPAEEPASEVEPAAEAEPVIHIELPALPGDAEEKPPQEAAESPAEPVQPESAAETHPPDFVGPTLAEALAAEEKETITVPVPYVQSQATADSESKESAEEQQTVQDTSDEDLPVVPPSEPPAVLPELSAENQAPTESAPAVVKPTDEVSAPSSTSENLPPRIEKRVIQPLNEPSEKPDLNKLLQEEERKEAISQIVEQTVTAASENSEKISADKATQPADKKSDQPPAPPKEDFNSIAL
jgi:CheY-like chemotaxis protein